MAGDGSAGEITDPVDLELRELEVEVQPAERRRGHHFVAKLLLVGLPPAPLPGPAARLERSEQVVLEARGHVAAPLGLRGPLNARCWLGLRGAPLWGPGGQEVYGARGFVRQRAAISPVPTAVCFPAQQPVGRLLIP